MSVGIIDVRDWQTTVDFETGKKMECDSELAGILRDIISKNRYPGDTNAEGIDWVADMALDISDRYNPNFMFLSFAQPYFKSFFKKMSQQEWNGIVDRVFSNVDRFLKKTGFVPVVVGLGSMTDLAGYIDLSDLDCLAIATNWSFHHAGLFHASERDLEKVKRIPGVIKIVSKEEFINHFGGSHEFISRFPDYLLVAAKGYAFKGFESTMRKVVKIPAKNESIPVYTPLGRIDSVTDIRKMMDDAMPGQKVALIVIEGIGAEDFKLPYKPCCNKLDWYIYEHLENQYLAITTGKHFQYQSFPPVFKFFREDHENKKYPFSGSHSFLPQDTIGRRKDIRSAAVGTRGMVTHVASGADVSIECFARNLSNFGTIAIINDPK